MGRILLPDLLRRVAALTARASWRSRSSPRCPRDPLARSRPRPPVGCSPRPLSSASTSRDGGAPAAVADRALAATATGSSPSPRSPSHRRSARWRRPWSRSAVPAPHRPSAGRDLGRLALGRARPVRVERQLGDQHRQRLLRRPAVQLRTWHGYGGGASSRSTRTRPRARSRSSSPSASVPRGYQPWPACRAKLGLLVSHARPGSRADAGVASVDAPAGAGGTRGAQGPRPRSVPRVLPRPTRLPRGRAR